MKLDDELLAYLRGERYANTVKIGYRFEPEDWRYRTQIDWLCELVRGKRVVHVGCVDHTIDTIRHKLQRRKWLHARLCESATRCHGVDIQGDGITFIREELGLTDVSCADILGDAFAQTISGEQWDFLLIPEVLEHLQDPTGFLRQVAVRHDKTFPAVIITVPNALSRENCRLARRGVEAINSDHCHWFTPYTAAKMVVNAGLELERILLCRHGTINPQSVLKTWYLRRHPLLRNDILCIARFAGRS